MAVGGVARPFRRDSSSSVSSQSSSPSSSSVSRYVRGGGSERAKMMQQACKPTIEQKSIAESLPALPCGAEVDVAVVGCGPAGLSLSAELAKRGLSVGLVGPDSGFVNTYGVWADEFETLGLKHTLERVYPTSVCYYGDTPSDMNAETRVERRYARVDRDKLRTELLDRCSRAGNVRYLDTSVTGSAADSAGAGRRIVSCSGGESFSARAVAVASGIAGSNGLLLYECDEWEHQNVHHGAGDATSASRHDIGDTSTIAAALKATGAIDMRGDTDSSSAKSSSAAPGAVQTAYGIEADVSNYPFDAESMVFMDYRRHHSGLWAGTAMDADRSMSWSSDDEVPSFLYAMPIEGTTKVFLEETCLVARPVLPFDILQQRLRRRCEALGMTIEKVHDEEWSYIPVGGAMPVLSQDHFGFGAAAGMVHPATGYSIASSLSEASEVAECLSAQLADPTHKSAREISEAAWAHLWSQEKRRQAAFNLFGMELLMDMPLDDITVFFTTFFRLPSSLWSKFLSNKLNSMELLLFAMAMFVYAPNSLRIQLLSHLVSHPTGKTVVNGYLDMAKAKIEAVSGAGEARDDE